MTWPPKLIDCLQAKSAPRVLFFVYAILLLPIYCLPICTPDEMWFELDAMKLKESWSGLSFLEIVFEQENHLGYGASYWLLYGLIAHCTSYPLVIMRVAALGANLAVPYLLLRECRDVSRRPAALLAMLLWVTFPAAWWTGKITGPELFSSAILFSGLLLLSHAARWQWVMAAGAALGCAVGIKTNSLPAILAIFFIVPQRPRPWRSMSLVALGLVIGFVVANPFVVFEPQELLANLPKRGRFGAGFTTKHFLLLLWNTEWEWDAVFRGGYFNWGMCPLAVPLYFTFLWKSKLPWKWLVGGIACTVAGFLLHMTSRQYHGWYWLPLLPLFPLTVLHVRKVEPQAWRWAMALVIVNLAGNSPWIGLQYYSKLEQFTHTFDTDEVLLETEYFAKSRQGDILVTVLDQGAKLELPAKRRGIRAKEYFANFPGLVLLDSLRAKERELAPGETWMIIFDQRLRRYNPIVDRALYAEQLGPEYELEAETGKLVSCLRIHRRLQTATTKKSKR